MVLTIPITFVENNNNKLKLTGILKYKNILNGKYLQAISIEDAGIFLELN